MYTLIDHTADLGIEVTGTSEEELFADAAIAMIDLIVDSDHIQNTLTRSLIVVGMDQVDLLINFLREILYSFNGENFLLKNLAIAELTSTTIKATLFGEYYDPGRHAIKTELKAVTYHQAAIWKTDGVWKARVIFDV